MRLRPGDVFRVHSAIEVERDVDPLHDRGRAAGEAAAPQGILHDAPPQRNDWMRRGIKRLALLMMLVGAVGAVATLWLQRPFAAESERPPQAGDMRQFSLLAAPRPAPEVAFTDVAGREIGLADFHGKLILLNLWATWCGPCVEEMPSLDRLQAKLGGP